MRLCVTSTEERDQNENDRSASPESKLDKEIPGSFSDYLVLCEACQA